MKKELLKYIDLMPDEMTKYIMTRIYDRNENDKEKALIELKRELAQELGVKLVTVTTKMNHAARIIRQEREKERKEQFEKYVASCYDEDGHLSLEKIAKAKNMDENELKEIFSEYVNSLTLEEVGIAYRFAFSLEALKLGNTQVLKHLVKGFSMKIDETQITYDSNLIKKMERQLLEHLDGVISTVEKMRSDLQEQPFQKKLK